ncbi:MAG TPA: DUF2911 domain-containing protein [Gemmatimonadaceae bacterium]|nr:DUF2911 domain-containing protein [Gemmatimonadaceae bacterium]
MRLLSCLSVIALAACATSPAATTSSTAAAPAPAASAAAAERGAFVVRLGSDTIAVERYTRDANRIEGDEAVRVPATALRHYVATLNPDGSVATLDYEGRRLVGTVPPTVANLRFGTDTVTVALKLPGRDTTLRYAARGALPYVNFSYALLEPLTMRAMRMTGDSAEVALIALGAPTAMMSTLRRVGSDSVTFNIFEPNAYRIHVDARGRILGLQGLATTQKVLVDRVADVDVRAVAAAWAARDSAGKSLGVLSPLDTMRAGVGAAQMTVVYSRPSVRGRTLLGGVLLPFGQVWRTGANAATVFTTSRDLVLGGAPVPAGSYTLWTIPNADGRTAKLVVNRQVGQWGTEYDATKDLVRVDAAVSKVASPVEKFTFAVEPNAAGTGGVLKYTWGDTQFSVPFTVK